MKKITILIATLLGFIAFVNAQISDSYVLTQNDLTFHRNGEYDEILITNENSFTEEIGNPQLPVKIVSYVLPYNSTVTGITVNSVSSQKLSGTYIIIPLQPTRYLDGSEPPPFVEPNPEVYNSNTPYPNKKVEIISDGYTLGYHIVTVAIHPIEYYPVNKEIYLRNISFTINYVGSFDSRLCSPFEKQSFRRYELGKQFVQSMVKNFQDVENCRNTSAQIIDYSSKKNEVDSIRGGSTSATDVLVPDYIIITNNALKPIFQQLADWKIKKGVPTMIKTVEEIEPEYQGSDLQEKILFFTAGTFYNFI